MKRSKFKLFIKKKILSKRQCQQAMAYAMRQDDPGEENEFEDSVGESHFNASTEEMKWVFPIAEEALLGKLSLAGRERNHWGIEVDGLMEYPRFLLYEPGDWKAFHVDYLPHRDDYSKLGMIVLISDPKDFDGGGLCITKNTEPIEMKQGDAIIFPGFLTHGVEKVTRGLRVSMAMWAVGPPFI